MKRKIIPYNPKLKVLAKKLRKDSTFTEIMVWNYLKKKQFYLATTSIDKNRLIIILWISFARILILLSKLTVKVITEMKKR